MNEPATATVKQGFYLRRSFWNFLSWRPVILTVAGRRLRLTGRDDQVLLDAAAPEVSARFSRFGLMQLSHLGRRYFLSREGAGWSRSFSPRQRSELAAAGMPVPGVAGGISGGGATGIVDAIAALSDVADGTARLASGGSLSRNWTPILTAMGCQVETRGR